MLNSNLYQVFIRNHTPEGTIKALIEDLDRIKDMGFDVIYLMPFHPISYLNRKGTYGSPYAIADYYTVSEDLGTLADMKDLLNEIHQREMKVIMDIVFNHAGADHIYTRTHPDYFLLDDKGQPTRKVADWSDIVDYNFDNRDLWNELKKVLMYWAEFGFDAYRCDVANLLPFEFWLEAISLVKSKYPELKWFSESVSPGFVKALRLQGETIVSDLDILRLFDGSYDYDIWQLQQDAMFDHSKIETFSTLLNYRYASMMKNKTKWHFIENHDNERLRDKGMSEKDYRRWLTYALLYPGMGFLYAGQESKEQPNASFFEKQVINRDFDDDLVDYIRLLNDRKKQLVQEQIVWCETRYEDKSLYIDITTKEKTHTFGLHFYDGTPENVNLETSEESDVKIEMKESDVDEYSTT